MAIVHFSAVKIYPFLFLLYLYHKSSEYVRRAIMHFADVLKKNDMRNETTSQYTYIHIISDETRRWQRQNLSFCILILPIINKSSNFSYVEKI